MKSNVKTYLDLYLTFLQMGAVTFGGGYAMLPIIRREVVEKRGWATEEELADYYALGQCTPGIIAVNTSTFVGYRCAGIPGGILATLGFVTPALVIISVIAALIVGFAEYPAVQNAFAGIRVCVSVLIINAVITLWKKSVTDLPSLLICLCVAAASMLLDISPVLLVLLSGAAGILIQKTKLRLVPEKERACSQSSGQESPPDSDAGSAGTGSRGKGGAC